MTSLYNCHTEGNAYRITKFSAFGDVESSYTVSYDACECPAGHRQTCRHRQMLPKFLDRGFVDTFYFYNFDRDGWVMNDLGQGVVPGNEAESEPLTIATYVELPADADVAEAFSELVSEALRGESEAEPKPWRRV